MTVHVVTTQGTVRPVSRAFHPTSDDEATARNPGHLLHLVSAVRSGLYTIRLKKRPGAAEEPGGPAVMSAGFPGEKAFLFLQDAFHVRGFFWEKVFKEDADS